MQHYKHYLKKSGNNSNILTRKQVAEILGVCKRTILSWEKNGNLKPDHYLSNRPRYLLSDVLKVPSQQPQRKEKQAE